MRILITYASAGAGHRRIAEALYNYLKAERPELELELADILAQSGRFFSFIYRKCYALLVHHFTWLWGFLFWLTQAKPLRLLSRLLARPINSFYCRKFTDYLIRENFDFIVSTHFLPSELAAGLKLKKRINSRLITVITDFGVHPFWVSAGTDLYVVATGLTAIKLLDLGVERRIIREFGIPFNPEFAIGKDRQELARKLDVAPDKFTVLLMTGSFGSGPLEKIAQSICTEAQVLVVCANNKRLFRRLQKKKLENVKVFAFVDNADELMSVSDLIVTKPGGSSIAELLNMQLFPVFICAIPGQERENIKVLSSYGVGYEAANTGRLKNIILELKNDRRKLEGLKSNIARIRKPLVCREISNVIR